MVWSILKWTGIIILLLAAGVSLVTLLRQHRVFEAPYPAIRASTDPAVVARGRHLVQGPAHCAECHSTFRDKGIKLAPGQEPELSGGRKFSFALGDFYSKNITPDKETGIGALTDGEVARVLRYGVKPNGEAVLPFMPFNNLSDEDLTAIVSYLRAQKPVHNKVPEHRYSVLGKVVKAYLMKPEGPSEKLQAKVSKDTSAVYGRYLALTVANCSGCHTRRDEKGAPVGALMAGGNVFDEPGKATLITPNLTPHAQGRMARWNQADFIKRFRNGRSIPHSHMPWEAYQNMTDDELKAIYNFLRSVKPAPNEAFTPSL